MKREVISVRRLQTIAINTARTHGLKVPDREAIARMYFGTGIQALPLIVSCDAGCLWVDRQYVAYQIGTGKVHYVYVTRSHIEEELLSYREASRERHTPVQLPPEILAFFWKAQSEMRDQQTTYWLEINSAPACRCQ